MLVNEFLAIEKRSGNIHSDLVQFWPLGPGVVTTLERCCYGDITLRLGRHGEYWNARGERITGAGWGPPSHVIKYHDYGAVHYTVCDLQKGIVYDYVLFFFPRERDVSHFMRGSMELTVSQFPGAYAGGNAIITGDKIRFSGIEFHNYANVEGEDFMKDLISKRGLGKVKWLPHDGGYELDNEGVVGTSIERNVMSFTAFMDSFPF